MSFLNNLTSKLDGLNLGSEKPRDRDGYSSQQNYPPPSQQHGSTYGQQAYPPYDNRSAPSPYQGSYSSPPPSTVEPTYSPPLDKPPIPAGWIPQFDQRYQRWYYFEQATSRSQWEAPGYHGGPAGEDRGWGSHGETGSSSHGTPGFGYSQESHGHSSHSGHGETGGYGYGQGDLGYGQHSSEGRGEHESEEKKKKKGGHGGLLMGAAGGLAVGAIGGALIAHALDDSDEEHHQAPAPVYAAPPPAPAYAEPVYEPAYNAEGEYVDTSDRESVRSAREDYEEALAEARDSSASSSDFEELEEAREEYEEEYEEAYD
ncbi:hypothetical protein F4804DRAFT_168244 [Jackrogersella minutella]|nr:hypothetical protein F4804DRAFT_168244 [Jackrogersella minutella]